MPSRSRAFSAPQFFDNLQGITGIGQFNAAPPPIFGVSVRHDVQS